MGEQSSPIGLVTMLTDFGTDDLFVGLCHAAVLARSPSVRIVDLSHAVAPQDVLQGAARLADAVEWVSSPAVHMAVVDPGVGTSRAAVAVETAAGWFVGPDNGLLTLAVERLGGARGAWALDVDGSASATFHARDVFAPAAGKLAAGIDLDDLGARFDPTDLVQLGVPEPSIDHGYVDAPVRDVDRFGNLQLWMRRVELERAQIGLGGPVTVHAGGRAVVGRRVRTFGDLQPGELGVLVDSFGWVAVVVAQDSASAMLAIGLHEPVTVESGVPEDVGQA